MHANYAKILSLINELNNEKMSVHGQTLLYGLFNEVREMNVNFEELEEELKESKSKVIQSKHKDLEGRLK